MGHLTEEIEKPGGVRNVLTHPEKVVEAVAFQLAWPGMAAAVTVNAMGVWLIKTIANVGFVFVVSVYWMALPLLAWTMLIPETRHIFIGWLKSYVGVAVGWPLMFAMAERLMVAMNLSTWMGLDGATTSAYLGVHQLMQCQLAFFILNVSFLGLYLAIPVASAKLVQGATSAFRGGE